MAKTILAQSALSSTFSGLFNWVLESSLTNPHDPLLNLIEASLLGLGEQDGELLNRTNQVFNICIITMQGSSSHSCVISEDNQFLHLP